jgi:hypothetical protein
VILIGDIKAIAVFCHHNRLLWCPVNVVGTQVNIEVRNKPVDGVGDVEATSLSRASSR